MKVILVFGNILNLLGKYIIELGKFSLSQMAIY